MLESSGASACTSASLTDMRASFAMWRTLASSTDMEARLASLLHCGKMSLDLGVWGPLVFHCADVVALGVEEADEDADGWNRGPFHRHRPAIGPDRGQHCIDI